MNRQQKLECIQRLLRSDDGKLLMEEMELTFDSGLFKGLQNHEVQYRAGQRDVFKFMKQLQRGKMTNE